jgi:hypothetical protein
VSLLVDKYDQPLIELGSAVDGEHPSEGFSVIDLTPLEKSAKFTNRNAFINGAGIASQFKSTAPQSRDVSKLFRGRREP